jgi:hypothetical protein
MAERWFPSPTCATRGPQTPCIGACRGSTVPPARGPSPSEISLGIRTSAALATDARATAMTRDVVGLSHSHRTARVPASCRQP